MILFGTSGYSYDDWRGTWYPPDLPKSRFLDYYAQVFDAVEINATYYRVPGRKTAEGMVRRAEGRLRFAIKAPGEVTHEGRMDAQVINAWRWFLEPFVEAGVLGAVLFQFPQRFHARPENTLYLERIAREFADLPLVGEFRHTSWDHDRADARIAELGFSRSLVDQPDLRGLSRSARKPRNGRIGYVRFHGRNASAWHAKDGEGNAMERYHYSYTENELKEWVPALREIESESTSTFVFFNNHPEGCAPADAEKMAGLLGVTLRGSGYEDLFS